MPRMTLVFVTFLAVAYGGLAFWHSGRDASGQTTTTVDVGDFYFCNSSFSGAVCDTNITAGDTVTWQWVGSASHTVTQCDLTFTTCPQVGGFDSGTLTSGTFSQTFNTPGSFEYRCNIHTTLMRGRINVAAQQATPTTTAGPTASAGATPSPAQASAPGHTTSPAPIVSAVPAAVPQTGGPTADGGTPWVLLLAASSVAVIMGGGTLAVRMRRR